MTMSFSRRRLVWARSGPVRRDPTRSRSLAMRHAPRLRPSRPPPYTKRSFEPRPPRSSPLTLDKVTRGLQLLVTTERLMRSRQIVLMRTPLNSGWKWGVAGVTGTLIAGLGVWLALSGTPNLGVLLRLVRD